MLAMMLDESRHFRMTEATVPVAQPNQTLAMHASAGIRAGDLPAVHVHRFIVALLLISGLECWAGLAAGCGVPRESDLATKRLGACRRAGVRLAGKRSWPAD